MVATDSSPPGETAREDARALHDDALVWDMTLPFQPRYSDFALLGRYRASGADFVSLTVNDFANPLAGTLLHLARVRQGIRDRGEELTLVESVEDIDVAKEEGKLALGFHFQETNPLEGSLAMIELYYQLGVRHMLLAYNQKNRVGDGCAEATDAALSRFGGERGQGDEPGRDAGRRKSQRASNHDARDGGLQCAVCVLARQRSCPASSLPEHP